MTTDLTFITNEKGETLLDRFNPVFESYGVLTFKIVKLTWQQKDNFKGVFRHFLNIFQTQINILIKDE